MGSGREGMNGKGINPVCEVIDPAGMEQIPVQAGVGAPWQQNAWHMAALGEGAGVVTKAGQARKGLAVPRVSTGSGCACCLPLLWKLHGIPALGCCSSIPPGT